MKTNNINRLIKVCLDSAIVAENSDPVDNWFLNELNIGIFAYANYMRQGVKDIIDLQTEVINLKSKLRIKDEIVKEYEKIASLTDLEFLEQEDLDKIKDYINKIVKETEV